MQVYQFTSRERAPDLLSDDVPNTADAESVQHLRRAPAYGQRVGETERRHAVAALGEKEDDRLVGHTARDEAEQPLARGVQPLGVVDRDHQRPIGTRQPDQCEHRSAGSRGIGRVICGVGAAHQLLEGRPIGWTEELDPTREGLEQIRQCAVCQRHLRLLRPGERHREPRAALNPTTGTALGWKTHVSAPVLSLDEVGTRVYAGIGGSGGRVISWDPSGNLLWTASTDGNVETVTLANGEVIAGGHYNNFCDPNTNCTNPVVRHHIAALNATTGALDTTWHPSVDSALGVYSLAATTTDLYVGGDFTKIDSIDQEHYADLAITP
jgi:hypothetical protein